MRQNSNTKKFKVNFYNEAPYTPDYIETVLYGDEDVSIRYECDTADELFAYLESKFESLEGTCYSLWEDGHVILAGAFEFSDIEELKEDYT